ncbi:wax ester synthase/diacylglycerol acyltransferase 11-like isoform X2 [Euphorbia lathyris]|uniref:wax ester synthase/diacylglycerol acyltransferase 11-like isoform X2 n=1 Tax=Euphorbia lathyris TaxID=212925 RepID=UPI003314452E
MEESSNSGGEWLSPAARLFHAPSFNCHIIAIIGCRTTMDPNSIKLGLNQSLIHHPRFSSKLVENGRKMKWIPTPVNLENHIITPNLDQQMESPTQFIENYISHLTTIPMDMSKPLWELHILNLKTTESESIGIFKIHHSMGDGASLMSLLLACTRKTCDPQSLPTVPVQKRASDSGFSGGGFWWVFLVIWRMLRLVLNTLVDLVLFVSTIVFLRDSETCLKGGYGKKVEMKKGKRFVYCSVSLDDVKLIKTHMDITINDVILGVTQAGLSRYLNRESGENNKKKRVRATVLVNLRPAPGIQKLAELMDKKEKKGKWGWGNRIAYVVVPFNVELQKDPLDYIRKAKVSIDRKKLSLEPFCTFALAEFLIFTFGVKALTIHFQSYAKKMTIVVAVDPDIILHPHKLLEDFEESLLLIRDSIKYKEPLDAA